MGKDMSIALWDKFDEIMSERGFKIIIHNDNSLGRGSVAYKDDKFVPLFKLHVWGGPIKENFISLHVEDRNGHFSLDGDFAAVYSLTDTGDFDKNQKLLTMMVDDCYETFGSYSKENRLDFVFNELTQIRKKYDEHFLARQSDLDSKLALDEQIQSCTDKICTEQDKTNITIDRGEER